MLLITNLKPTPIRLLLTRNLMVNRRKTYKWKEEGIQYPCFKYYPSNPKNFEDPPYEPSKLFMVKRIKPFKGCQGWEKEILKQFSLVGKSSDLAIVKNIPEINGLLWKIKHLIKITPITFPNGEPTETTGTFLRENGEFIVSKKLEIIPQKLEESEKFETNPKKMDGDTLRRRLRIKWLQAWDTTL